MIPEFITNWSDSLLSSLSVSAIPTYFTAVVRFIFPVLAIIILVRCATSLLGWKREPEVWGYFLLPDGIKLPITHWENSIGRAASSDIRLNYPWISRSHAVLVRSDDGTWVITDLDSKGGIAVNDKPVDGTAALAFGDVLGLSGIRMTLVPVSAEEKERSSFHRAEAVRSINPAGTLTLLTIFILLAALQLCFALGEPAFPAVPIVFGGLAVLIWVYYIIMRLLHRRGFEVETIAFLLCTLGFSVIASSAPEELYKQAAAFLMGFSIFVGLGWFLRNLDRVKKARWPIAAFALALFAVNLVLGETLYGAKNWIIIGPLSFQPSELIKIAFIFAGASTLDRLLTRRNIIMFIGFSAACVGALALMNDFGTALIFFCAFLVMSFMRSGNLATILLAVSGAGFAGVLVAKFKPYVLSRFSSWRHAWEYAASGGYQQTRTMMYAASGGLVGLGAGCGRLHSIVAADTDLVFGMICEEWGLIVALAAVVTIIILALFTFKSAAVGRSSYYVIAACSAMSMLLVQTMLNVFGSVDILPLTGVTFPFISNGGSSMLSSWGLLAFVKAADTRQSASFAAKMLD